MEITTHTGAVSRTAEGFYEIFLNGVQYLSNYFAYTGKESLLRQVQVKTLGTRLITGFFFWLYI